MKTILLQSWLISHNIQLSFKRRDLSKAIVGAAKFYTQKSESIEVIDGGILCSACGNGNTRIEALRDFARAISEKRVLIGGYGGFRTDVPKLVVTSLKYLNNYDE